MKNINRNMLLIACMSILLFSCRIGLRYQRSAELALTEHYRGQSGSDTSNIADLSWKTFFADTLLKKLIDSALKNNLDLKTAVARMGAAEASLRQSKAMFFPSLTIDADYSLTKNSPAQLQAFGNNAATTSIPSINTYALTGTTSWEADIWGKLRGSKRAALANYLQSDAYKRAVQTRLISQVAQSYYALAAYDKQLEITLETIRIRQKDISTVKALMASDKLNGADVVNSESNLYAAQVTVPDIQQNITELENAISLLLGKSPDTIYRSKLEALENFKPLNAGVPAQLLRNRPDIQQAEFELINKFELVNVARSNFYPQLTISATGGWATVNSIKSFFDGTFYGNLIGGLTQPIFNQGLNKQRLKIAQSEREEALNNFKYNLLNAYQETANALASYRNATNKFELRTKQVNSLTKSVEFTQELLSYTTTTNYVDVLTAETNLLNAQLNSINDRLQQLQAGVDLYRSLGGGQK